MQILSLSHVLDNQEGKLEGWKSGVEVEQVVLKFVTHNGFGACVCVCACMFLISSNTGCDLQFNLS